MSDRILGTCSICGGPVTVPAYWLGINFPTPSCQRCGAVPTAAFGPVIPMKARQITEAKDVVGVSNSWKKYRDFVWTRFEVPWERVRG